MHLQLTKKELEILLRILTRARILAFKDFSFKESYEDICGILDKFRDMEKELLDE
jgi:hypothetical protein